LIHIEAANLNFLQAKVDGPLITEDLLGEDLTNEMYAKQHEQYNILIPE
jgi:hypothetical protein